jgi:hypothetical protein
VVVEEQRESPEYKAPVIVSLGKLDDLTSQGLPDSDSVTTTLDGGSG